jgi:hypothetical protein
MTVLALSELTVRPLTCPGTLTDGPDSLVQAYTRVPPEYATHMSVAT